MVDGRFDLIRRNTAEIVTEAELRELLEKKEKPVAYWGTAITGKPHVAYFFPILKIADFLRAGFKFKVLLADLHGALDNCPWIVLEKRYAYYEKVIPLMFKAIGVDVKNLELVKGSEFQLKPEYAYDILKLSTEVSMRDCKRAASEVVKFGSNPRLSGFIYPIMQALDEEYLGVDVQLGGTDQRKILMFARENLPKIGYNARIEVMNPLIPGLTGKKMSASDEKSKIDLLDSEEEVERKIRNAYMVEGNPDNAIMAFLKYVIMTLKQDKKERFRIERDKKFGGDIEYESYEEIEKDYVEKKLHPLDVKIAVAKEINKLLGVFRKNKKILEKLAREAYS